MFPALAVVKGCLPLLTQAPGNDSRMRRGWGVTGCCPGWRHCGGLSSWGGSSSRTGLCGQGGPHHPALGLRATEGVMAPPPPAPSCSPPALCFLLEAGGPSFPPCRSILIPVLPAWVAQGTHGGVITGHGSPRGRMEEAQQSAGTHQRPRQALAAGRRGRAAHEKGGPANFLNPSPPHHQGVS